VELATDGLSQVYIPDGACHIMNLKEKICTCSEFQEYLIPGAHNATSIFANATGNFTNATGNFVNATGQEVWG
jgi:hypothetical protein